MSTAIVWLLTQLVKFVPSSHSKERTALFLAQMEKKGFGTQALAMHWNFGYFSKPLR